MSEADDAFAQMRTLITSEPVAAAGGTMALLGRVCSVAVRTLSASGAGISMMTDGGVRGVCAASDASSERLEELQFTLGEGPCIDAFESRRPVLVSSLADGAMRRWPVYAPTVHDGGVRAVFAFPLQVGAARLGVLDIFRERPGPLAADELRQALVLSDVTVAALLDQQEQMDGAGDRRNLDEAMERRVELFQAQGMVMVQLHVGLDDAMARIRAYAYAHSRRLDDVARDIVDRRLHIAQDHQ